MNIVNGVDLEVCITQVRLSVSYLIKLENVLQISAFDYYCKEFIEARRSTELGLLE